MKSKTIGFMILTLMSVSLLLTSSVSASVFPSLPEDPVTLSLAIGPTKWPGTVTLISVPAGDYDVSTGSSYPAWCAQLLNWIDAGTVYPATLESSLDLLPQETWGKINWLLNQPVDMDLDVQIAIWLLLGYTEADLATHGYSDLTSAQALVASTVGHESFVPTAGQIVVVYCKITAIYPDPEGEVQDLLIQLEIPSEYEGLTPGFWKNHPDVWEGYSTDATFSAIFGRTITINAQGNKEGILNPTLIEAVGAKGGGINALARHAVAALLNAAHPEVNYPMSTSEIINAVQDAIDSGDAAIEALKNQLDMYNNAGGGIDAHGNPI